MKAKYETLDEYLDDLDAIKEKIAERTHGMTAKQVQAYFARSAQRLPPIDRAKGRRVRRDRAQTFDGRTLSQSPIRVNSVLRGLDGVALMATAQKIKEALSRVHDLTSLVNELLAGPDALQWPIEEEIENPQKITFGWTAEELKAQGLEKQFLDGEIRQFGRFAPVSRGASSSSNSPAGTSTGQPCDRCCAGLVPSRRRDPSLQAWHHEHILFICTTRDYDQFTFAHFRGDQRANGPAGHVRLAARRRPLAHSVRVQSAKARMAPGRRPRRRLLAEAVGRHFRQGASDQGLLPPL